MLKNKILGLKKIFDFKNIIKTNIIIINIETLSVLKIIIKILK
jgi:hypothetical protein